MGNPGGGIVGPRVRPRVRRFGPWVGGGVAVLLAVSIPGQAQGEQAQGEQTQGEQGEGGASSPGTSAPAPVPPPGSPAEPLTLAVITGEGQFWYVGRQLREPVVFRISGTGLEEAGCHDLRVYFTSDDAERVSPVVGDPRWEEGECRVRAWWTLGYGVGRQHLRAELPAGGRRATTHAVARQGARIFFGGAWTPRQDGWTELRDDAEGPSLRNVQPTGAFRPVLGVDFPAWPTQDRIRLAAAAASPHLDQFFFFGFSGLQAFLFGPAQEGSPVDLHLGFQLSRREVGRNGPACDPDPACTVRDLRFGGFSVLVTVDGASAFRGLAGAVLR